MRNFNTNEITGTFLKYLLSLDAMATAVLLIRTYSTNLINTKSFFCDLTYTTNLVFSWSTGFINMALCVERCVALAAPFWYYSHASSWKAHIVAVACIVTALILCLLPVFGLGSYRKVKILYTGTYVCISPPDLSYQVDSEVFAFAVIFLAVGMGILLVIHVANIIVVVNIIKIGIRNNNKIGVVFGAGSSTVGSMGNSIRESRAESQDHQPGALLQGKTHKRLVNKEIRLALVIVALSFVFTVAWLPYYVERSFKAFSDKQPPFIFLMISVFFLLLNHILDPFVYVFLKSACRRELFRLIREIMCCWRRLIRRTNTVDDVNTVSTGLPRDTVPA
ncbi:prostaglandin E2 receptor EP3 subtype-like [Amphiura filiformis]|uniref:prostaglandin E2 receptor EP3 subtype-like n=1 Tax=Amphiura filiformis TaxID=82378 RepID=UPI003B212EDE